jgi:hypothetical protein
MVCTSEQQWQRARVQTFLGIERTLPATQKAAEKCNQRGCAFSKRFVECDVCKDILSDQEQKYDHVCCFQGLDQALDSERAMRCLFQNVSALLSENGLFFGLMMVSTNSCTFQFFHRILLQYGQPYRKVLNPVPNLACRTKRQKSGSGMPPFSTLGVLILTVLRKPISSSFINRRLYKLPRNITCSL